MQRLLSSKFIAPFLIVMILSNLTSAQYHIWPVSSNYIQLNPNSAPIQGPLPTYTGLPAVAHYDGTPPENTSNAMINSQGELQFFIVDGVIYDHDGAFIDMMEAPQIYPGENSTVKGLSEVVIVPDPGNCKRYYIFSTYYDIQRSNRPYYSILDMGALNEHASYLYPDPNDDCIYWNPRRGALVPLDAGGNLTLPLESVPGSCQIIYSALNHGNITMAFGGPFGGNGIDQKYFLLVSNGVYVFRYEISASGLSASCTQNDFFYLNEGTPNSNMRSEMELVRIGNGKYVVAVPYYAEPLGQFWLSRMSVQVVRLTEEGVIETRIGFIELPNSGGTPGCQQSIHGLEFTPWGNRLYFTKDPCVDDPGVICYADIDPYTNFQNGVSAHEVLFPGINLQDFQYSFIESDDQNIYFAHQGGLARLINPNNPSLSDWLPNFLPFNNPIIHLNSTSKSAYPLPDQLDGLNYLSFFKSTAECCSSYAPFTEQIYCADATATWSPGANNNPFGSISGVVSIGKELRIPAGITITMNNMKIEFGHDARLLIEDGGGTTNGGKLILNNSTLTNYSSCGNMWQGVRVLGNSLQQQGNFTASPQGWLDVNNGSVIEHAIIAAGALSMYDEFPGQNKAGGVIRASGALFFNNVHDVDIRDYGLLNVNNQSRFINTIFRTDGILRNNASQIEHHVFLRAVSGVKFLGCTFENRTPESYDLLDRGVGIITQNARYSVEPICASLLCPNPQPSRFNNLYLGVLTSSSNGLATGYIDRCSFQNVVGGVVLNGADFSTITRNQFQVNTTNLGVGFSYHGLGVYLNGCTGYQVEQNVFTEYIDPSNPASAGSTFGIIVNNSGTDPNLVYRNDFSNIRFGVQAQGINAIPYVYDLKPKTQGLEIKCNRFLNVIYQADISVTSGYIAPQQGGFLAPGTVNSNQALAGNEFSSSNLDPQNNYAINNIVEPIRYNHHVDAVTTPTDYNVVRLFPFTNGLLKDANACPSKIKTPSISISGSQLFSRIADLESQITSNKNKIDCGNTNSLLSLISGIAPAGQKKNQLLNCSPYLSDQVLIAYILSNPSAGHVSQVLIANSPLSTDVLDILRTQNLPSGIATQISNAQLGISAIEYIENEIEWLRNERWLTVDELIRITLNDTSLANPIRDVEQILRQEGRFTRRSEQRLDALIALHDTLETTHLHDSLLAKTGPSNILRLSEVHLATINFISPCQIIGTNNTIRQITEDIAFDQTDRVNCVHGEALLYLAFDSIPSINVEQLLPIGNGRMSQPLPELQGLSTQHSDFTVYPNPATNMLFAELDNAENAIWQIIDAQGRTVLTGNNSNAQLSLDITPLPSGIYHLLIQTENKTMQQRFVVRK